MKTKLFIVLMILGLVFTSCEDWLKVNSETELSQDDMFSSDEGFHTALTGVYIGMTATDLYGMHLSWHMLDYLAHYYCLISGSNDTYLHSHQYKHTRVYPYIKGTWNGLYNLIANCNNILAKLEEHKSELNPINYQLVKGEALTLRAFFHFDLMRMFGFGNLRNRDVSSKKAIPYVTTFSKEVTPQLSYSETFELLKKDLLEAIDLLYGENGKNCYRITGDDDFFDNGPNGEDHAFFTYFDYQTSPRVDYYVAKAILARVYMWEGTDEGYAKAAEIAEEWFLTEDGSGQDCWDWVSRSRVTNSNVLYRDRTFSQEHIWHLSVTKLNDIIGNWLDASNPNATYERIFLTQEMAFSIFEVGEGNDVGVNDYRYSYLLQPQGSGLNNYATLKLDQCNGETNYGQKIPLISTPEMYYICAEVYAQQGNLKKAISYLNTVRRARGITADLDENLTYQEVREEILKEYRKEFVSLGQLFYFYKRWGVESVAGYADIMDDTKYVLPYPDEEVISGNRVQF